MQCHGHLRIPLWSIIKSIGHRPIQHDQKRHGVERLQIAIGCRVQQRYEHTAAADDGGLHARDEKHREHHLGISGLEDCERTRSRPDRTRGGRDLSRLARCIGTARNCHELSGRSGCENQENYEDEVTVATNEGRAPLPPSPLRIARTVVISEEKARERERVLAEQQAEAKKTAFEDVVNSASGRDRDSKFGTTFVSRLKRDDEFTLRYFAAHRSGLQERWQRKFRRWQIQDERHASWPRHSDQWLSILRMLDHATPNGKHNYTKRNETVRLPKGVRAVFSGNAQSRILEIMQRTGSHVQMVQPARQEPASFADGFEALTLWGLPADNAHAIRLLPSLVTGVTEDSKVRGQVLQDHELQSEIVVDKHPAAINDNSDSMDAPYWRDEEKGDEGIEDVMDDITYAPPKQEVPTRAIWTRRKDRTLLPTKGQGENNVPIKWTTISFAAYVEDLIRPLPRQLRKQRSLETGHRETEGRVEAAIEELQHVFLNDDLTAYISSESVDNALRYLIHHRAASAVKRILVKLEGSDNYKLTTSNFDVLLAYAALFGDLHNFRYILRLMIVRGIQPSWRTWVRYHGLVCERFDRANAKGQVLDTMREKGVLANPQALRETVVNIVGSELQTYITTPGKTLDGFFALYDEKFGNTSDAYHYKAHRAQPRPWLSTSAANRMITCLLDLGRIDDALTVVTRLAEAGEQVEIATLNTFLTSAYQKGDAEQAIAVLNVFAPFLRLGGIGKSSTKLNEVSFALLLRLAWAKRHYNMLKVVWRYACMSGHVQWDMNQKMWRSVISYVPALGPIAERGAQDAKMFTSGDLWYGWAGKFICGVIDGLPKEKKEKNVGDEQLMGNKTPDRLSISTAEQNPEADKTSSKEVFSTAADGDDEAVPLTAVTAHSERVATTPLRALSDHQQTMLDLSMQPRTSSNKARKVRWTTCDTTAPSASQVHAHNQRREKLSQLHNNDLDTAASFEPLVPFHIKLEEAWLRDMDWRNRGLGYVSGENGLAEAARTNDMQAFGRIFEQMLDESLEVPIRVARMRRDEGSSVHVEA